MTYNGMVVARPLNKSVSKLFASPDECAERLNLMLPKDKTLGEMLDEGHSRFSTWHHGHTHKIRKVDDMRGEKGAKE